MYAFTNRQPQQIPEIEENWYFFVVTKVQLHLEVYWKTN